MRQEKSMQMTRPGGQKQSAYVVNALPSGLSSSESDILRAFVAVLAFERAEREKEKGIFFFFCFLEDCPMHLSQSYLMTHATSNAHDPHDHMHSGTLVS